MISLYFLRDQNILLCAMSGCTLKTKTVGAEIQCCQELFDLKILPFSIFSVMFYIYICNVWVLFRFRGRGDRIVCFTAVAFPNHVKTQAGGVCEEGRKMSAAGAFTTNTLCSYTYHRIYSMATCKPLLFWLKEKLYSENFNSARLYYATMFGKSKEINRFISPNATSKMLLKS